MRYPVRRSIPRKAVRIALIRAMTAAAVPRENFLTARGGSAIHRERVGRREKCGEQILGAFDFRVQVTHRLRCLARTEFYDQEPARPRAIAVTFAELPDPAFQPVAP